MIPDLVAAIDININPELFGGGFSLTWHGLFTAIGIAAGVWLALRFIRRIGISEDDGMAIALVAVPAGIVGARLLWVLEHTDQIHNAGDIFALTDGGISVYGAMIGGALGGFLYVTFFRKDFPVWMGLDAAAPGMLLGQTIGRVGDFINGEHFAKASDLPWAFRYTNANTDGPWAVLADGEAPAAEFWHRGDFGQVGEAAVAVHPVAGGYEPLLDLILLGGLFFLWARGRVPLPGMRGTVRHGWVFITYVLGYAMIRGLLGLLRTSPTGGGNLGGFEQDIVGAFSVPQLLAILTALAAAWMAYYLLRNPQPPIGSFDAQSDATRREARQQGRARRAKQRKPKLRQPGPSRRRRSRR